MEEVKGKDSMSLVGIKVEESLINEFTEFCNTKGTNINDEIKRYIFNVVKGTKTSAEEGVTRRSHHPVGVEEEIKRAKQRRVESKGFDAALTPLTDFVDEDLRFGDEFNFESYDCQSRLLYRFLKSFKDLSGLFSDVREEDSGFKDVFYDTVNELGGSQSLHTRRYLDPKDNPAWSETAFGKIAQLEEFRKDVLSQLANLVSKEALEERLKDYVEHYDGDFDMFVGTTYELGGSGSVCKDEEGLEEWQQETAFGKISVLETELAELKALVGNLTKPQESEESPYEQRLIYNSERKYEWNGHAFRSEQEVRVAKALEARNVCFFPNAGCRVDEKGVRKTREVDFLVMISGRMGVLECDGRYYHKIAADDHERDRNFQRQGITFIQRYDSTACLDADAVVDDFIKLMKAFYNL